jgi:hypothetical protein
MAVYPDGQIINLAGNPGDSAPEQKRYWWRYRMGVGGNKIPITDWAIEGVADIGNNWQGFKPNASFLLWVSLLCSEVRVDRQGKAFFRLKKLPPLHAPLKTPITEYRQATLQIFANPQRARAGLSSPHWVCQIGEREVGLSTWQCIGKATNATISPGINPTSADPTRRVFIKLCGTLRIYEDHHAAILLEAP